MTERVRTEVEIRPLAAGDEDALRTFLESLPEGDRTFFREDVLAPGTTERWLAEPGPRRLVALVDGDVAGLASVLPGVAWSRHVAEIRLVIGPSHRGQGLGRLLAQRAVVEAVELGVTKLVVEVVAEQEATVGMFTKLGFTAEGLLKDHVKDRAGQCHDLLILSHFVEELWATMATTGLGDALAAGGDGEHGG